MWRRVILSSKEVNLSGKEGDLSSVEGKSFWQVGCNSFWQEIDGTLDA